MVAVAVAVAARRRHLQQPRQLRVAERRVRRAAAVAGEGGDDAAEREQRHVRRLRLVGGDANGARLLDALRAGEVDQVQLGARALRAGRLGSLLDDQGEEGVAAR